MIKKIYAILLSSFLLSSCITGPYKAAEKKYNHQVKNFGSMLTERPSNSQLDKVEWNDKLWAASTNISVRKPNFVVIHHTAQNSTDQTIKTFQLERTQVSSHYVVGRDGRVVQMVNDYVRAHHAGVGKWGNVTDMNSVSLGIEMDNNGTTDPWPEVQIDALIQLLKVLKKEYNIPQANFIGHADWAPGRKVDPYKFPWKRLAQEGFGYWYDEFLAEPPANFDPVLGLKIIGYDIRDINKVIQSFKIRYNQEDPYPELLTLQDTKIIYNLYKKHL